MTRINPDLRKPHVPPPKVNSKKYSLNRRSRKGKTDDELYLVLRDVYLECNPLCVVCDATAGEVHHIVSGGAGKEASRLNQDTWLGVCRRCHVIVESLPWNIQAAIKLAAVASTNEGLRT